MNHEPLSFPPPKVISILVFISQKSPAVKVAVIIVSENNMIRSTTLSATMVPKDFAKGIPFDRNNIAALEASPALGMVKLIKYPIIKAWYRFQKEVS
jgi:hypothetical protein